MTGGRSSVPRPNFSQKQPNEDRGRELICFLVLAHKEPAQVGRLAERLAPNRVLLHVDARVGGTVWQAFAGLPSQHGNVEMLPRYRSGWASWGLAQATLSGIQHAATGSFSHLVVMTGQDYLLRPLTEIASLFASQPDVSWVVHDNIPVNWIGDKDGGVSRVTHWHLAVKGRRVRVPLRRRAPEGIVPCYGHAQCVLSMPLARWIVDEVERRPELVKFFRRSWIPDELFLQSLVASSPMSANVVQATLWYADWSAGGSHPRTFTESDIDRLVAVGHGEAGRLPWGQLRLFARKFDVARDSRVLDLIDEHLLLRSGGPTV